MKHIIRHQRCRRVNPSVSHNRVKPGNIGMQRKQRVARSTSDWWVWSQNTPAAWPSVKIQFLTEKRPKTCHFQGQKRCFHQKCKKFGESCKQCAALQQHFECASACTHTNYTCTKNSRCVRTNLTFSLCMMLQIALKSSRLLKHEICYRFDLVVNAKLHLLSTKASSIITYTINATLAARAYQ